MTTQTGAPQLGGQSGNGQGQQQQQQTPGQTQQGGSAPQKQITDWASI